MMDYYSAIKKEWNNAICSNMDGPRDYHTKWSKSEKDKDITDMWNLKNDTKMNLFIKQKQTHRLLENNLTVTKGERGGGEW